MFVARDVCTGNMCVHVGGLLPSQTPFAGVSAVHDTSEGNCHQISKNAISWLASNKLLTAVMTSVADLETILQKVSQDTADLDLHDVIAASRDAYDRLQRALQPMFAPSVATDAAGLRRPESSLLHRLTFPGRSRTSGDLERLVSWAGSMMGMAEKLEKARVSEGELRAELDWVLQEREERDREEIGRKEQNMDQFVSRDKFDILCEEQANSLQRELQAQKLLSEQATRLNDLSTNRDAEVKVKVQREQELAALRQQYESQSDALGRLKHQASMTESETKLLRRNVSDAETALRTAARDREALGSYMKMVLEELEKLRVAVSGGTDAPFADLLTMKPPSSSSHHHRSSSSRSTPPELTACQTLVAVFVETHRQQGALIAALRGDVETFREHTASLKSELSAACKRQYGDELQNLKDAVTSVYPELALPASVPIASSIPISSFPQNQARGGLFQAPGGLFPSHGGQYPAHGGAGDHVDEFTPLQEDVSEYFEIPRLLKPSIVNSGAMNCKKPN